LESQRVKCLIEGYLRGWLTFNYPASTSRLREELILNHIEEERLFTLLEHKLFIDTVLRGTMSGRSKATLEPIFETSNSLIELKLPSVLPKATIKEEKKKSTALTADDLKEWKTFLDSVNNKK
jgi:hypothetical protein